VVRSYTNIGNVLGGKLYPKGRTWEDGTILAERGQWGASNYRGLFSKVRVRADMVCVGQDVASSL